jgi:hypothetical protein
MDDAVLCRRAKPRTPVAQIVGIRAREESSVAAPHRQLSENLIELRLAVVATI